jgi:transposase-like protein
MSDSALFKWRHFEADLILCAVRWYWRYALSYRDLEEIMLERGLHVDHTTIFRWVQRYAPKLDQRCRPHLKATNNSYRVDETYIKIEKQWHDLYRVVDSTGHTLDYMLSTTRDAKAAERFFRKALRAPRTAPPQVITVDNNAAYPPAFEVLQ